MTYEEIKRRLADLCDSKGIRLTEGQFTAVALWADEIVEDGLKASILLRTIAAEAMRTGSWHVPPDLQEAIMREVDWASMPAVPQIEPKKNWTVKLECRIVKEMELKNCTKEEAYNSPWKFSVGEDDECYEWKVIYVKEGNS